MIFIFKVLPHLNPSRLTTCIYISIIKANVMFSELWNLAVECIMTSKFIIQKEVSEYLQVYIIKHFKNVLHWYQHIYMNTPLSISFIQNKNLLKLSYYISALNLVTVFLCSWLISIHTCTCRLAWFKLPMFPKKINGKSFSSTIVFIFHVMCNICSFQKSFSTPFSRRNKFLEYLQ